MFLVMDYEHFCSRTRNKRSCSRSINGVSLEELLTFLPKEYLSSSSRTTNFSFEGVTVFLFQGRPAPGLPTFLFKGYLRFCSRRTTNILIQEMPIFLLFDYKVLLPTFLVTNYIHFFLLKNYQCL
ncbi:hypothetical protein J6590_008862 [Homalodisca vitripennis]|nr:hypothetical protein J6590_008862 [Homalodisca vitripennis]